MRTFDKCFALIRTFTYYITLALFKERAWVLCLIPRVYGFGQFCAGRLVDIASVHPHVLQAVFLCPLATLFDLFKPFFVSNNRRFFLGVSPKRVLASCLGHITHHILICDLLIFPPVGKNSISGKVGTKEFVELHPVRMKKAHRVARLMRAARLTSMFLESTTTVGTRVH
jgi:hypothetical protein